MQLAIILPIMRKRWTGKNSLPLSGSFSEGAGAEEEGEIAALLDDLIMFNIQCVDEDGLAGEEKRLLHVRL